ncbi:hypothetical protein A176_004352 [Myxococcus hansupus]|uniref:Peptidase M10 metallopeptidase domain-containing protein n=1 Tax=Pseudomyxococcus hansupus TaxID=1297742 RepID=A0A0H4X1E2_9BACT|nr:myxosortase-dependent metalloprotease, MXAN_2677/MXAN_2678 family [Myxococcus hansupus]AKQ67440.1 hypothetical protein A176_004352 [Myxococcus hansupus]
MRTGLGVVAGLLALGAQAQMSEEPVYRRTVVPGHPLCLLWPVREYVYHLDAAGSARTPGNTEVTAIEASFDSWRRLSGECSDFQFIRREDKQGPVVVGYDQTRPRENYNIITFRETSCREVAPAEDPCWDEETCGNVYQCWEHGMGTIGLTTSTFSYRDGRVLDSDIEMNASQPQGGYGFLFTTVDSPVCERGAAVDCVSTDLQNTMTHEIGHVVGLDHVFVPGATMEATAPPGEIQKRIIDPGSAEGFCSIYPRHLPPTQCFVREGAGMALKAEGRGSGCAAAPGQGVLGLGLAWAALALVRGRRRAGGQPVRAAAPGSRD